MDIKIVSGQYQTVYCDYCGKEIKKHNVRRVKRKLEGKANFCCNDCKYKHWKKK